MPRVAEMLFQPTTKSEELTCLSRQARACNDEGSANESGPFERPIFASPAEILYVEHLRLRLRERYPDEASKRAPPWCVGAD